MAPLRILIAGAGIAGLAVRQALALRGVDAELVERNPAPPATGTGLYLPANAVRALGDLGLGRELAELAGPVRRQEFRDHRGRRAQRAHPAAGRRRCLLFRCYRQRRPGAAGR